MTKIEYGAWDGNPAILATYDDGRILGFEYKSDKWHDAHWADITTKAITIDKAAFEKRWPTIGLPSLPK